MGQKSCNRLCSSGWSTERKGSQTESGVFGARDTLKSVVGGGTELRTPSDLIEVLHRSKVLPVVKEGQVLGHQPHTIILCLLLAKRLPSLRTHRKRRQTKTYIK